MIISRELFKLDQTILEMEIDLYENSNNNLKEKIMLNESVKERFYKIFIYLKELIIKIVNFFRKIWAKLYSLFTSRRVFVEKHKDAILNNVLKIDKNKKFFNNNKFGSFENFLVNYIATISPIIAEIKYTNGDIRNLDSIKEQIISQKMELDLKLKELNKADKKLTAVETIESAIFFFKNKNGIDKLNNHADLALKTLNKISSDISTYKDSDVNNKEELSKLVKSMIDIIKTIMTTLVKYTNKLSNSYWELILEAYSLRLGKKQTNKIKTNFNSFANMTQISKAVDAVNNGNYNMYNTFVVAG